MRAQRFFLHLSKKHLDDPQHFDQIQYSREKE